MSHVVTIKTQIKYRVALRAACVRLKLAVPIEGEVELYQGKVRGWRVDLPGWRYPVVCQLEQRQVLYDNFEGRWGDQKELDKLLQAYAVEQARIVAQRAGHSVTEQRLSDGSIRLSIQVGGAA